MSNNYYGMPLPPTPTPPPPIDMNPSDVNVILENAVLGYFNTPDSDSKTRLRQVETAVRNNVKSKNLRGTANDIAKLTVANFLSLKIGKTAGKRASKNKTRRTRRI